MKYFLICLFMSHFLLFSQKNDSIRKISSQDEYTVLDTIFFEGFFFIDPEKMVLYEKNAIKKLKTNFRSIKQYKRYFKNKSSTPYFWVAELALLKGNINTSDCKKLDNVPIYFNHGGIRVWSHGESAVTIYTISMTLYKIRIKKDAIKKTRRYLWVLDSFNLEDDYIEFYTFYDCIK